MQVGREGVGEEGVYILLAKPTHPLGAREDADVFSEGGGDGDGDEAHH